MSGTIHSIDGRGERPTISPTMRVSTGDVYLPFLTLIGTKGKYFFCTHEKRALPSPSYLVGKAGTLFNRDCRYKQIQREHFDIILEGIKMNERHGGYYLNPHAFLVGWCLAKGVDLYGEDLLHL